MGASMSLVMARAACSPCRASMDRWASIVAPIHWRAKVFGEPWVECDSVPALVELFGKANGACGHQAGVKSQEARRSLLPRFSSNPSFAPLCRCARGPSGGEGQMIYPPQEGPHA